jgi:hypothetical protein
VERSSSFLRTQQRLGELAREGKGEDELRAVIDRAWKRHDLHDDEMAALELYVRGLIRRRANLTYPYERVDA